MVHFIAFVDPVLDYCDRRSITLQVFPLCPLGELARVPLPPSSRFHRNDGAISQFIGISISKKRR